MNNKNSNSNSNSKTLYDRLYIVRCLSTKYSMQLSTNKHEAWSHASEKVIVNWFTMIIIKKWWGYNLFLEWFKIEERNEYIVTFFSWGTKVSINIKKLNVNTQHPKQKNGLDWIVLFIIIGFGTNLLMTLQEKRWCIF